MHLFNKNTTFFRKVLFPTIICFIISYFLDKKYLSSTPIYLMPIFFSIIVGSFNYKYYRHKIYFNQIIQVVFISTIIAFLCLLFVMISYLLIVEIIDILIESLSITFGKESISKLAIFFTSYLVAPLIIIFAFKGIFVYPKEKTTKIIIVASLVVSFLLGYLIYKEIIVNKLSFLWFPIMILSIQLILYQREIFKLDK
jgi:hypothetical protein